MRNPCHRLDGCVPPEADRQIGVWCITLEVLQPQLETLAQSKTEVIPRILAPTRYDNVRSWSHVNSRHHERREVKKQNNMGNYSCDLLTSEAIWLLSRIS